MIFRLLSGQTNLERKFSEKIEFWELSTSYMNAVLLRLAYPTIFLHPAIYRLYIAPGPLESCWGCSYMFTRKFLHEFPPSHVSGDLLVAKLHHLECGGSIGHPSSVSMGQAAPELPDRNLVVKIFQNSNFRISSPGRIARLPV